jgi:MarC family membrane protein
MDYTFVSALTLLILLIDPFGNIPIFANTLKTFTPERRLHIIIREHIIAFCILLCFMLAGKQFLSVLGLSIPSLQIGGAVVLFLIAIRMIFPPKDNADEICDGQEPLIVPLAIPLVAGPGALAAVMLMASQQPTQILSWIGALGVAILVSCAILLAAAKLQKKLGMTFTVAMEKLMGLILVALSVELLIRGIRALFV